MTRSIHPAAQQELNEAFEFYHARGGSALACAFLDEIQRVAAMLEANPQFGAPIKGTRRRFSIRRFPFSLVYRIDGAGIRILAFAHQRRQPGYWDRRG